MKKAKYFFLTLVFFNLLSSNADAYLDPGTGSYVLQIIIAGIFAGGLVIKIFWQRCINFFKGIFSKKKKEE